MSQADPHTTPCLITGRGLIRAALDAYEGVIRFQEALERQPKHLDIVHRMEAAKLRGRPR